MSLEELFLKKQKILPEYEEGKKEFKIFKANINKALLDTDSKYQRKDDGHLHYRGTEEERLRDGLLRYKRSLLKRKERILKMLNPIKDSLNSSGGEWDIEDMLWVIEEYDSVKQYKLDHSQQDGFIKTVNQLMSMLRSKEAWNYINPHNMLLEPNFSDAMKALQLKGDEKRERRNEDLEKQEEAVKKYLKAAKKALDKNAPESGAQDWWDNQMSQKPELAELLPTESPPSEEPPPATENLIPKLKKIIEHMLGGNNG